MDDSLKYETIPRESEKVNNLFTMYSMSGDPEDFSSLIDYEQSSGLITALSKTMSTEDVFLFVSSNKFVNWDIDMSLDTYCIYFCLETFR